MTIHIQQMPGQIIELRHNNQRGLLLCKISLSAWNMCFQDQQAREELFTFIKKYYYGNS